MADSNSTFDSIGLHTGEADHPAWNDEPIICRVEVDLPNWLAQLTGSKNWEVYREHETDTCINYVMRQEAQSKNAEVTLYHNGYAIVDVEGEALFDGVLTTGTSENAHLSYFHASGEEILLH